LVGDPGVLDGIGRVGVAELSLKRRNIAGFIYMVSAHGIPGVMGRVPSTPARLQTSFQTVLITLAFRRPLPCALVAGERNSAGDFHLLKSAVLSLPT